jgi:asparagine synthase (glutamine-hydrolysing)
MCGIAGILTDPARLGADALRDTAQAMGATLAHRGPDGDGVWSDPQAGIALAHRRLAVIAPTPEGAQPALSACGRYALTFNGEIYNFRDLQHQLADAGSPVEADSDTVVLLAALARWGVRETIARAVGMFAFALWDRAERRLTLVRDRLGIKPLYWAQHRGSLIFGSELKALRAAAPDGLAVDPLALEQFFRFGYVPSPLSIWRGVAKLAPGTLCSIGPDLVPQVETWWDAAEMARRGQAEPLDTADPETVAGIERALAAAVSDRMISDVPLGAWLSGGIDSSSVVAMMQASSDRPVRTFSIGFAEAGYDESAAAAAIARHLGSDHTELRVDAADAIDAAAELPRWYDEPFADSSQVPTLLLSRLTRGHVTVALSGDGGDEVFAGYNRYVALPWAERRRARWSAPLCRAGAAALRLLSPAAWDALSRALPESRRPPQAGSKMWKLADVLAAPDLAGAYRAAVSQWQDPQALLRRPERIDGADASTLLEPVLADPLARLQLADTRGYLPDDILTKVDRASMANALEVRVPLLDHRLVEYAWRLPRPALIGPGGAGKQPLRAILRQHVPDALVERPKAGFALPIGDWLRGPLRGWAEELLSPAALDRTGLLDAKPIRAAWQAHLGGRRQREHELWTVLMFQAWAEMAKP